MDEMKSNQRVFCNLLHIQHIEAEQEKGTRSAIEVHSQIDLPSARLTAGQMKME